MTACTATRCWRCRPGFGRRARICSIRTGVPVIAVPFGYTPRPVAEFNPDRLIGHFDEAYDAIQELFAEA